jgi:poly-gamma-glutamate synthase PgsB/CapB
MERLPFGEHPDNVAVALAICNELDISREVALSGMQKCRPDPGAYTECILDFFGRKMLFCNAFAANDPISTAQTWNKANAAHPELKTRIAIFNCRVDRPDRSLILGKDFVNWTAADHVVLMGNGTFLFANTLTAAGFDASRLVVAEGLTTEEIFERLVSLVEGSALLMGMGNVGGLGLELARHFKNRAQWEAA